MAAPSPLHVEIVDQALLTTDTQEVWVKQFYSSPLPPASCPQLCHLWVLWWSSPPQFYWISAQSLEVLQAGMPRCTPPKWCCSSSPPVAMILTTEWPVQGRSTWLPLTNSKVPLPFAHPVWGKGQPSDFISFDHHSKFMLDKPTGDLSCHWSITGSPFLLCQLSITSKSFPHQVSLSKKKFHLAGHPTPLTRSFCLLVTWPTES